MDTDAPTSIVKSIDDIWKHAKTYRYWMPIQTRWSDNDQYGHMNNAYYYHLFDTTVNKFLIENCPDDRGAPPVAFVVSSSCTYLAPVGFPTTLLIGLATEHVGRSSVRWRLGLWPARAAVRQPESVEKIGNVILALERDEEAGCAAFGSFTHVFVDSVTRSSVEMNSKVREATTSLLSDPNTSTSS
ncbi:HotDog domain-containing protein [Melampsora americana]|nr:HotDog domain-containing protein [Melampsora americana]